MSICFTCDGSGIVQFAGGDEICPECLGEDDGDDMDDRDDLDDEPDSGYGACPLCGGDLTDWGLVSHGDGDLVEEIGCDLCEEVIEERHVRECQCSECRLISSEVRAPGRDL